MKTFCKNRRKKMKEVKFYRCNHCGNIIEKIVDSGVSVICCGEEMTELVPNTTDAATEKHVPVVVVDGSKVTVQVGSVAHPMTEEHYIQWICLVTSKGIQRVNLSSTDKPEAVFYIGEEKPVAVYEYCNLHGLWKKEL